MTKAERRYMVKIASLSCACCGASGPSFVHHIREGQGMAQRASNWLTIPLCHDCHQDPHLGIHGERVNWKIHKMSELDALADTISKVAA